MTGGMDAVDAIAGSGHTDAATGPAMPVTIERVALGD